MSKKRILFVRPSLGYGGADRVTVNLLNHFDSDKYEVELALMHSNGEMQSMLDRPIKIHDLKVGWLGFAVNPLMKLIRSNNYDVLYSTCGGMSIPMMIAAKRTNFRGLKVVSERNSLHRTYSSIVKKKSLLSFKKRYYKQADLVTVVSREIGSEVQEVLGVNESQIRVVNNPLIGDSFFSEMQEEASFPSIETGTFNILAIGRFVKQKDYGTMLKAFNALYTNNKNVRLNILGKGPLQKDIEDLVDILGITNVVSFLGFDSNPFKYLRIADAFILSSLHEGMPGVLVQAMAAGLPVISTDCPTGPNEIIDNNKNGILIPVSDISAAHLALESLLHNPEKSMEMGKKAALSIERYSINNGVDSYFKILD
ncbi:MAG: hypothetical protein COA58_01695 [Bacteroidetes bacterium]|nr:MAG: hypothetical protein COA58_01695 [Bacteroidota bacterium]